MYDLTVSKIVGIIAGILVAILIIVGFASITTVPTGYVGVKTRFGEVQQSLINKWNGVLPTTSLGENIPMLNIGK